MSVLWQRKSIKKHGIEENSNGRLVHSSDAPRIFPLIVARLTLLLLFSIGLLYMLAVPALMYLIYAYMSIPVALLVIILSSPFWAKHSWPAFAQSYVFATWRSYFEFRVHREEAVLPRTTSVMFAVAPHGLFPLTLPLLGGVFAQVFPELGGQKLPSTAVANVLLCAPILSPLMIWLGCIPAHDKPIRTALRDNNCIIVPDGIAGAYHSNRNNEALYIDSRKGFIKIALEEGALLVPIYCFGHTQLFDVYPSSPNSWIARLSRRLQFSILFFVGDRMMWPVPLRVPLMMAVGKGIQLGKCDRPDDAMVDLVHSDFKKAVSELYYAHRSKVPGYENKDLIML